jgi:hypothetical protein
MRRLSAIAILGVVTLGLAACGEDRPDRAITVEPSETSTSNTVENADAQAEEPAPGAGDRLSTKQAKDALIRVQDLPSGWAKDPNEDDDEDDDDPIEPASCDKLMSSLNDESKDGTRVAHATASFSTGGLFGTVLTEEISSFKEDAPVERLQDVADVLGKCPTFTSTDADGVKSRYTVSPMSMANLGDQTLAMRMDVKNDTISVQAALAYVVVGHNVVTFSAGGIAGVDGAQLEKIARTAIARLEKVAKR